MFYCRQCQICHPLLSDIIAVSSRHISFTFKTHFTRISLTQMTLLEQDSWEEENIHHVLNCNLHRDPVLTKALKAEFDAIRRTRNLIANTTAADVMRNLASQLPHTPRNPSAAQSVNTSRLDHLGSAAFRAFLNVDPRRTIQ